MIKNKRNKRSKVDVEDSRDLDKQIVDGILEMDGFSRCLVDFKDTYHCVDNGCDVLSEALAVDQGVDSLDNLNLEVNLLLRLVCVKPRYNSNQERCNEMKIVVLCNSFHFLDHLKGFLADLEVFELRLA